MYEASDALVLEAMAVAGSILRQVEEFLVDATDVRAAVAVHRERSVTSGERLPAVLPAMRDAMIAGGCGTVSVSSPDVMCRRVGPVGSGAKLAGWMDRPNADFSSDRGRGRTSRLPR